MNRDQLLNDSETAVRTALDGRQSQIWTALPAIVTKVNRSAMTVEAQPAIQGVITDETGKESFVNLPLLVDMPLCFPSAGGFTLTLPINVGDEVLVVIASRCIDAWWQNGGVGVPMEARMHDLSDGFALPGPRSQPRVVTGGISATDAQLRNDAGTAYLSITPAGLVKVVASTKVQLSNPTRDLLGVLNGMLDLLTSLNTKLSAFATTTATDPVATVTAGAAATLLPLLATLGTQITNYKTTDTGALLS